MPLTILASELADSGAMTPPAQFYVEDSAASGPWAVPFVLVRVNPVDVCKQVQGVDGRLFLALALEEFFG